MKDKYSSLIPGILLVLAGILLLLHNLHIYRLSWSTFYPLALLFLGLWFFAKAALEKNAGLVFSGSLLFLFGTFFFLRNVLDLWWTDELLFWPVFLIIPGLSFLIMYLFRPREWGILVTAVILLFLGGMALGKNLGWYYEYPIFAWGRKYWPVLLIVLGIYLVVQGAVYSTKEPPATPPAQEKGEGEAGSGAGQLEDAEPSDQKA